MTLRIEDFLTHNADSAPPPMRTQKGISYQFHSKATNQKRVIYL
jgi:hypothetical protein